MTTNNHFLIVVARKHLYRLEHRRLRQSLSILTQLTFVVIISKLPHQLKFAILPDDSDSRMLDAIKKGGFHHRVVNHIFKNNDVADL